MFFNLFVLAPGRWYALLFLKEYLDWFLVGRRLCSLISGFEITSLKSFAVMVSVRSYMLGRPAVASATL